MIVRTLTALTPEALADLQALMACLSERFIFSPDTFQRVVSDPHTHLIVAEHEGHIVGCATLCEFSTLMGRRASVEDVIVLPHRRGCGIGRMLMEHVIHLAQQQAPITLQLTSRPHRQAARHLYRQMGFTLKETGFFQLKMENGKLKMES